MWQLGLSLVLFAVAIAGIFMGRVTKGNRNEYGWSPYAVSFVAALIGSFLILSTSFTIVDSDEVGHLKRIYGGSSMPSGQIIALKDQSGPQAEVLSPGFKFRLLLNVLYHVEKMPVIEIPADSYGFIVASDGSLLRPGQILADKWSDIASSDMLDAEYFLRNGGQKGPQLSILPPGKYRLNKYLFQVEVRQATNIRIGTVGVVKSNVQEISSCVPVEHGAAESLAVPLMPKGCIGVWVEALSPGRYYLNHSAYEVTEISTQAHSWEYRGGYERRVINLAVDQEGKITQNERTEVIPVPEDAADKAVLLRVEGWNVPLELRVIIQVTPEDAPFVVASVGSLVDVENNILTPTIRSVARNVVGAPGRQVMELQDKRAELESLVEAAIIPEGRKAGISIKEVRFGEPVIPPELLVTLVRRQLAMELEKTYTQEQMAQEQRILTEKSKATADEQHRFVAAQVNVLIEMQNKEAAKLRGEGRELELTAIARGQKAQVDVLGQDRVLQLEALLKILEAAIANPDIVKVPVIMVQGSGTGLEGFAAILGGASNIAQINTMFDQQEDDQ